MCKIKICNLSRNSYQKMFLISQFSQWYMVVYNFWISKSLIEINWILKLLNVSFCVMFQEGIKCLLQNSKGYTSFMSPREWRNNNIERYILFWTSFLFHFSPHNQSVNWRRVSGSNEGLGNFDFSKWDYITVLFYPSGFLTSGFSG